jgi:hypothetical protein
MECEILHKWQIERHAFIGVILPAKRSKRSLQPLLPPKGRHAGMAPSLNDKTLSFWAPVQGHLDSGNIVDTQS